MGFISEDRKLYGSTWSASVKSNIVITYLEKALRGNILTNARG